MSDAATRPSSLSDFFRYHGVWAPGIRLFRQLRFRAKALLISLALLLPALVLGTAYLRQVQSAVDFAQQERVGVAAMTRFVPVLLGVLEARNATRATLGGHDASAAYQAARADVDRALQGMAEHLKQTGDPMQLQPRLDALQQAWQATASSRNGADDKGRTVFGPVTEASLKVLQALTDESKLVLDPELDSLYMIMALMADMPRTSEDLGQLWGWGTYAVARGGLETPEQNRRYVVWNARAGSGIETVKGNFAKAIAANPDLKDRLDLKGLDQALAFQAKADPALMVQAALEPGEVFRKGQAAVRSYFSVYESALPALDGILARRIDALALDRNVKLAVVLLGLGLGAYLFVCFARVMDGGLRQVGRTLDRMAEGDLSTAPVPWGRDEAAELMHALGRMQASVQRIVLDVREAAGVIVHASQEIASGSSDLSSRTERTASELQHTAAALEQIGSTVAHTTQNTERAAELAQANAQAARRSGEVIEGAVQTMSGIDSASRRISEITSVIDGIAFQTNILALNAAVEAARAGEHGRGFAVVAGEVRSLAQRASGAAREIRTLIDDTVQQVQQGTRVVTQAGTEMRTLVEGAREIDGLISAIATAAEQQNSGVRSVGQAVGGLDEMTQQNAALVEETAAATESLRQRASHLADAVSRFRVQAGPGTA